MAGQGGRSAARPRIVLAQPAPRSVRLDVRPTARAARRQGRAPRTRPHQPGQPPAGSPGAGRVLAAQSDGEEQRLPHRAFERALVPGAGALWPVRQHTPALPIAACACARVPPCAQCASADMRTRHASSTGSIGWWMHAAYSVREAGGQAGLVVCTRGQRRRGEGGAPGRCHLTAAISSESECACAWSQRALH